MAFKRFTLLAIVIIAIFTPPASAQSFDFSLWDKVLKDHVSQTSKDGVELMAFDYESLSKDKRFHQIISDLKNYQPKLDGIHEKISFWANVYNIFAAKVVTKNMGVKSIREVGSFFSPVWGKDAGMVGGKTYSLDQIEHKILRPLGDPRIHAAIVCASVSCPDLRTESYSAKRLDEQLGEQWRRFLANEAKGLRIDKKNKTIYLSKILKWFSEDFDAKGGTRTFIAGYVGTGAQKIIMDEDYKIVFIDYNWSLNSAH